MQIEKITESLICPIEHLTIELWTNGNDQHFTAVRFPCSTTTPLEHNTLAQALSFFYNAKKNYVREF